MSDLPDPETLLEAIAILRSRWLAPAEARSMMAAAGSREELLAHLSTEADWLDRLPLARAAYDSVRRAAALPQPRRIPGDAGDCNRAIVDAVPEQQAIAVLERHAEDAGACDPVEHLRQMGRGIARDCR